MCPIVYAHMNCPLSFLLFALAASLSAPLLAADTGYLVVHSAHQPVSASGCPHKQLSMSVQPTEHAAKAEGERLRSLEDMTDMQTDILPPGRYSIVYKYQGRSGLYASDCEYTRYATITGDDEEDAKRRLAAHVAEYRSYFLSEPEIVRTWTGDGMRRLIRDYDGVQVSYLASEGDGKSTVHAQVRNPHQDRKAVLRFRINGILQPDVVEVPPGGGANVPLGRDVREFAAAVQLADPGKPKSRGVIDQVKNLLREQLKKRDTEKIEVREGKLHSTCMCVKG